MERPDVIAITDGYHSCHGSIEVYRQMRAPDAVQIIKHDDPYLMEGKLLCWVETPLNPTGECRSIEFYAKKAHAAGGTLGVDSTFGPPPLQDPFKWGADVVMLPIIAKPMHDDGLSYVPKPRFSKEGFWRMRKEWPKELR